VAVAETHYRSRWLDFLAVSTALFAVLAAVAALLAGDSANEALYKSNLATLSQAGVSDVWSEFQANSLQKAHAQTLTLLEAPPDALITPRSGVQIQAAQREASRRQREQDTLKEEAERQDAETKGLLEEAQGLLDRHRVFALGLTLFQVAIGLSAIAGCGGYGGLACCPEASPLPNCCVGWRMPSPSTPHYVRRKRACAAMRSKPRCPGRRHHPVFSPAGWGHHLLEREMVGGVLAVVGAGHP